MNEWIIVNIEPSLAWMGRGECVFRGAQNTYTLREMRTGRIRRVTCALGDRWADSFLNGARPVAEKSA